MTPGLVSVLLPVYNQRPTLKEAIDSVLNQEYSFLELIVLNDGSTDSPKEVISVYSDPRLKYYALEHKGLAKTLNDGLHLAKGEFITWTSADNLMLPNMLSELVSSLRKFSGHVAAYAGYFHIDAQGRIIGKNPKGPYNYTPRQFTNEPNRSYLVTQHCNLGAAFLYRATACEQAGEFDPDCDGAEDVDYSIRLARIGPILFVPKLLYQYRLHDESMSGRERKGEISYQRGRERLWEKIATNSS